MCDFLSLVTVTQASLTALRTLWALLSPLSPANSWSFTVSAALPFPECQSWNHAVCRLCKWLLLLSIMCLSFLHVFLELDGSILLIAG